MIAEVQNYQTHHWKCERCGDLVKRAMNRPPQVSSAYSLNGSKFFQVMLSCPSGNVEAVFMCNRKQTAEEKWGKEMRVLIPGVLTTCTNGTVVGITGR